MRALHNNFVWTQDGPGRLFDSIDSPASCWDRAFNYPPLRDDCDGFHSALYWAVSQHFSCRLLTVATLPLHHSHTVLIIRNKGQYHLANYTYLSTALSDLDAVIKDLFRTFYRDKNVQMVTWELSVWDKTRWTHAPLQDFLH
ncbi:hypothetical protein [Dethiobacter alkaliphilus]|uniref:Uncharacterized protein n=1 Tax=Dethiobacter alkaliphilus AHT 1 TaxID=555088 RepID=C0GCK8_DETAL|nr:hypothetical protein [Dethiobacter alkaliphilus]EEG78943.1 hypothetical protein DealDRAFT_0217 [Dethiobacter alkaliphilus AHT 1]